MLWWNSPKIPSSYEKCANNVHKLKKDTADAFFKLVQNDNFTWLSEGYALEFINQNIYLILPNY